MDGRKLQPQESKEQSKDTSRFITDYEPKKVLGYGGFGVVIEAHHRIDKRKLAVKRVKLPPKTDARKSVMREVECLASLDSHVNIVGYMHTFVEEHSRGMF